MYVASWRETRPSLNSWHLRGTNFTLEMSTWKYQISRFGEQRLHRHEAGSPTGPMLLCRLKILKNNRAIRKAKTSFHFLMVCRRLILRRALYQGPLCHNLKPRALFKIGLWGSPNKTLMVKRVTQVASTVQSHANRQDGMKKVLTVNRMMRSTRSIKLRVWGPSQDKVEFNRM